MKLYVPLAVATAFGLAACSSSGSTTPDRPSSASTPSNPSPSATTSTVPPITGSVSARAKAIGIRPADLPGDVWVAQPNKKVTGEASSDRAFDACLHVPDIDTVRKAYAISTVQRTDKAITISSEVNVLTTVMAHHDVSVLESPAGPKCQLQSARRDLASSGPTADVAVRGVKVEHLAGTGPDDRLTIALVSPKTKKAAGYVYIDAIAADAGPYLVQLTITSDGAPAPVSLDQQAFSAVIARARAAAAG